ncbi:unnamed protein product [Peniophora sp. CBMAI 1063]|nr:unnamed protein product [Peniophora sp. CBMAI 1063]
MQLLQTPPVAAARLSPSATEVNLPGIHPHTTPASPSAMSDATTFPEDAKTTRIYAGKLFDSEARILLPNRLITIAVDSGLILSVDVYKLGDVPSEKSEDVIDLSDTTVFPGLVDTHVHFFLHSYSETTWDDQLTKESLAERTVRATVHAKRTLMAGFTSVRDLGTEGAFDADIALRKCLSGPNALIPGPRYFCASKAIIATGSYGPKSSLYPSQDGIDGVTGAEIVDGEVECLKAVRRQIGAGADWIKIYADYRVRSRMADVAPGLAGTAITTFNKKELQVMIDEATSRGVKVAIHAADWGRIRGLAVNTIEHGAESIPPYPETATRSEIVDLWRRYELRNRHTTWVPTLAVMYNSGAARWARASSTFRAALEAGYDNIACGGDTGAFAHGENALELQLMEKLGAPWQKVLSWATLGGWKSIRPRTWEGREGEIRLARVASLSEDPRQVGDNEVAFGIIKRGFVADIVATTGDLEKDFPGAVSKDKITFVMKGGRVYKHEGRPVADY